jgi:hypothetical protein
LIKVENVLREQISAIDLNCYRIIIFKHGVEEVISLGRYKTGNEEIVCQNISI